LKDSIEDSSSRHEEIRRYVKPACSRRHAKTQSATGRLCDLDKSGDSLSALKFKLRCLGAPSTPRHRRPASEGLKRVLFVAVADAANTGERIESATNRDVHAPVLIEPFKARISWNPP
jgi:hypothetical protein